MRRRGEGERWEGRLPARRGKGWPQPLSAAGFVAELRRGGLPEPERAELRAGVPVVKPRPVPAGATALAALHERLVRVALAARAAQGPGRLPLEALTLPLVRIGPYDLWRPALGLALGAGAAVAAARPATAGLEARAVLLAIEALSEREDLAERLGGYASAPIKEVWVVDLRAGWTEAYRSPWAGAYRSRTLWYPGEALPVGALQGVAVEALDAG